MQKQTHLTKQDLSNAGIKTWAQFNATSFALPLSLGARQYLDAH